MPATRDATPGDYVAAPVRSALDGIVTRGVVAFVLIVLAVGVTLLPIDESVRLVSYHALPALLAVYLLAHQVVHVFRSGTDDPDAWQRARDVDASDTMFARIITFAVPAGTLLAGAALLCPHLADPDDRARVLGVFLPLFALLWIGVTFAWTDECRSRLARAAADSDRRFRAYWAGIGRA